MLILDYHDSYTNNLLTLFTELFAADSTTSDGFIKSRVHVVEWDDPRLAQSVDDAMRFIHDGAYDCLILSPGPGRPDRREDVGYLIELIHRLPHLPILGVCLGMQALAVAYGGKIDNVPRIRHGHVIEVEHQARGLFEGLDAFAGDGKESRNVCRMVSYNSLMVVDLPEDTLDILATSDGSTVGHSEHEHGKGQTQVQALQHRSLPHMGVQFHPESIESTDGARILGNFLKVVEEVCRRQRSLTTPAPEADSIVDGASVQDGDETRFDVAVAAVDAASEHSTLSRTSHDREAGNLWRFEERRLDRVLCNAASTSEQEPTPQLFDRLCRSRRHPLGEIWLDGETPGAATASTMALPSFLLTYCLATRHVECHYLQRTDGNDTSTICKAVKQLSADGCGFWDWFAAGHAELGGDGGLGDPRTGRRRGPGWYGWWGYEMKAESLAGYRRLDAQAISAGIDACWAWCPSVVVVGKDALGQASAPMQISLAGDDVARHGQSDMVRWLNELGVGWTQSDALHDEAPAIMPILPTPSIAFDAPCSTAYLASIDACRQRIYAGDSYELTLTAPFKSPAVLSRDESYAAYLALRSRNPAPYSTYIHLPTLPLSILSSSPERFIRIHDGHVEMKPIKGTRARVRTAQGSDYIQPDDSQVAQALANDPKERAENLMIVDLIRSDLHACCRPESVRVPKLIALESYARVHQLVSTVTGQLADHVSPVEAVKRCFPPGSMTGAPKLRSVEILETLEKTPRGIYSGALGHMGLNGDIDLSVVIRTVVCDSQGLSIGGGGAITWLSDPASEWQEVLTKVYSVAKAFTSATTRPEQQTTPGVGNR